MCTNYVHIENGRLLKDNPQLPTTITTKCNEGFKLSHSKTLKCVDGSWDAELPECRGEHTWIMFSRYMQRYRDLHTNRFKLLLLEHFKFILVIKGCSLAIVYIN